MWYHMGGFCTSFDANMNRKVQVSDTLAMRDQVAAQTRTVLEGFLYDVAVQHMRLALRERRRRSRGGATNEEMKAATIAIVASVTCLEAFANAEGARHLSKGRTWKDRSLAKKWEDLYNSVKRQLPKRHLNNLQKRRHFIIHYKGEWSDARFTLERQLLTGSASRTSVDTCRRILREYLLALNAEIPDWLT